MTELRERIDYVTLTDADLVIDGVRLAYADHGSGDPVVFIHGTPSHSFLWRNVVPQVKEGGYRLLCLL